MQKIAREILLIFILASLVLGGCQGMPEQVEPSFKTLAPVSTEQDGMVLPAAGALFPAVTPTPGAYTRQAITNVILQQTTSTPGSTPYPQPEDTDAPGPTAYIGPAASATPHATYTTEPRASQTLVSIATSTALSTAVITPQESLVATEFVGQPLGTPAGAGSVVSIWHGLIGEQARALDRIVDSFQNAYPAVSFDITYVPKDELRSRYEAASYIRRGPSLLLGPTEWGWWYAQNDLVTDLSAYASAEFLATINPAAVDTLKLSDKLIGLPFGQQGYVMYRNVSILPQQADNLDTLIANAQRVTGMGKVGGYLEREALVSSPILVGLGGSLMDEQGRPAFNNDLALEWFNLLGLYADAGIAGMHTNRDLELFRQGKIGVIFEGTWRLEGLVSALGGENVAIDPWPKVGGGQLSGYVQTEAVFLNTSTSQENLLASLRFMGYLLNRDVQTLLGESGVIPTVLEAKPRSVHIQQAMRALEGGTAWPMVEEAVLQVYWNALDEAINGVFERGMSVTSALQSAYDVVNKRLDELEGK